MKKCKLCNSIHLSEDYYCIKCNNCGFVEIKDKDTLVKRNKDDLIFLF